MPSCLGLYVEDKLIKYAKVSTEKDKTSIDNFGVEFYEDLPNAIAQIIEETASEKTPISINVDDETYDEFKIFSLLNKKDLEKAINTEVESIYFEKGISRNNVENRYIILPIKEESDRAKIYNISVNKTQILEKSNLIGKGKLVNVTPLPIVLPEIIKLKEKENSLIVNIEQKTTFTAIIDGNIYEVQKTNYGMKEILEKINLKENSYSKAYKICKNTTIFTSDINELDNDSNLYLEDIMPTLYNIVGAINEIVEKLPNRISKVYITGSAALINNIDLYFKEYLEDAECVILKPSFIDQAKTKINVKDYIEVNSAIAMAITALQEKKYNINFLHGKGPNKTKSGATAKGTNTKLTMPKLEFDFKSALDKIDVSLIRGAISVFLLFIIYVCVSLLLSNNINKKNEELSQVKTNIQSEITVAKGDLTKLQTKIATYKKLRTNLENINKEIAENNRSKNLVPNFLYHVMNIIPDNVQITSIDNTTDKHIVMVVRARNYQDLGYFTAALKTGGILNNIVSGNAVKKTIQVVDEFPENGEKIIQVIQETETKAVVNPDGTWTTQKNTKQKAIIPKEIMEVTIEGDL